ncbi:hypothetical protein Leryth_014609 [Lithospermum erythrorhizon]|nr:hypothetical protein Leryth_014609 [Lithospermum erythrorhizon]
MKRIQKGPVRGISLKLQEEERESLMDFVPDESAIKIDVIDVDKETLDMLSSLGMGVLNFHWLALGLTALGCRLDLLLSTRT